MTKFISKASLVTAMLTVAPASAWAVALEQAPVPPTLETGKVMDMKHQSGIGSEYAYSTAGVVEVGGAINYSSTDSQSTFGFTPSVGYFFLDNFQISALTNYTYARLKNESSQGNESKGDSTTNSGSLVLEPSLHLPLTRQQFVFGGLGVGTYFAKSVKTGFALAPRVGMKTLVGRSGMLSVALQGVYSINKEENKDVEGTVITVEDGVHLALGYSVLL